MIDKSKSLTPEILQIVRYKKTELPYSGKCNRIIEKGSYLCRQCGLTLFRSFNKFDSQSGWPSFDSETNYNVLKQMDEDGERTEILCKRCLAHLGHIFYGEGITSLNTRYCVNSLSIEFVSDLEVEDTEEAIIAGGCFWGIEHLFKQLKGVIKTEVGYMGGHVNHPTYDMVCQSNTGHREVVRVVYNPILVNYINVLKYFFEIHDPTQTNGQGPDLGEQYQSVIFYFDERQKIIAVNLLQELINRGYPMATFVLPVHTFWPAEDYHQNYYENNGKKPYCHQYIKRFEI